MGRKTKHSIPGFKGLKVKRTARVTFPVPKGVKFSFNKPPGSGNFKNAGF
jgi:hypothetical protein